MFPRHLVSGRKFCLVLARRHRRLLEGLAEEADLNDRALVTDLWSQIAKLDPNDLEPQLRLLDLALQGKNKADIENRLNEIKRIEGSDGLNGSIGEARFTLWQSANTADRSEQARLRSTAELQLKELMQRLPNPPQIPRMLAGLTLTDLSQPDLSEEEKTLKMEEAAELYQKAIELGQRDLDTILRATELLYVKGLNKSVVTPLWEQLSKTTTEGNALVRQGLLMRFSATVTMSEHWSCARNAKDCKSERFPGVSLAGPAAGQTGPSWGRKRAAGGCRRRIR